MTKSLSLESWSIFFIGMADLATTLIWVQGHGAAEANPVFAHYLAMGPVVFCMMKLVMLAAPIFLLEWARRRRPQFTIRAARFTICAYLVLYGVGFLKLNSHLLHPVPGMRAVAMADLRTAPYEIATRRTAGL